MTSGRRVGSTRVHVPDLSDGHCRGLGDLFYPEGEGRRELVVAAIQVCRGCPIKGLCRAYAEKAGEEHGIWGGIDLDKSARRAAAIADPKSPRQPRRRRPTNDNTTDTEQESTMTNTRTDAELIRIGAQIQQLRDDITVLDTSALQEIVEHCIGDAFDRGAVDELVRILDAQERADAALAAAEAMHAERRELDRQRAEEIATIAALVECPSCDRPAGEACTTLRGNLAPHPHAARVAAGREHQAAA